MNLEWQGFDPFTRTVTRRFSDGKRVRVDFTTEIGKLPELNAHSRETNPGGNTKIGKHVARLPLSVFLMLQKKGVTRDSKRFNEWLNRSENKAAFSTTTGVKYL